MKNKLQTYRMGYVDYSAKPKVYSCKEKQQIMAALKDIAPSKYDILPPIGITFQHELEKKKPTAPKDILLPNLNF